MTGQRNDSVVNKNWIGYGSKDANETFSEIFVYNYTGLREQSNQAKFEDMFLENIGHCKIMTNYPNPIKVGIIILILKFITVFFLLPILLMLFFIVLYLSHMIVGIVFQLAILILHIKSN